MSELEIDELLAELDVMYPFFEPTETIEKAWYEILHPFSYKEVKKNLEKAMGEERFQKDPPQAYYLVQGLTPIVKKVDFNKIIIFCPICKRAVNKEEEQKHVDRCRSIHYIANKYKKMGKEVDKRSLWEMHQEEFDKKYDEFLHRIYENTTNEHEKIRIGYIFNPPKKEKAKRFINGNV